MYLFTCLEEFAHNNILKIFGTSCICAVPAMVYMFICEEAKTKFMELRDVFPKELQKLGQKRSGNVGGEQSTYS